MRSGMALVVLLAACGTVPIRPSMNSQEAPSVPEFVLEACRSDHLQRAKVHIGADGRIEKYVAYVAKDAIPAWVHEMADEKIGTGQDEEYEIETYADGSEVYEVRRCVGDKSHELSVKRDRSLKYVERQLDENELPEAVRAAIRDLSDFALQRCAVKEGPNLKEYQITGKIGDRPFRARIQEDGALVALQKKIEGGFEIALPPSSGR